jgi:hypothetical protein
MSRALRRIFEPKREEVTGMWGKLHKEDLDDLYSSSRIIITKLWKRRWARHVAQIG